MTVLPAALRFLDGLDNLAVAARAGHDFPVPGREVALAGVGEPDPGEPLTYRVVVDRLVVAHTERIAA